MPTTVMNRTALQADLALSADRRLLAWWTKWLPVSAKADAALFLASEPALTVGESRATELNLVSVFRAPERDDD